MKPDIAELKRLAQAATPGPWTRCVEHGCVWRDAPEALGIRVCECDADDYDGDDDEEAKAQAKATATYIAAANPQTILTLIGRLETLEAERKGTVQLTLEQARAVEFAAPDSDGWPCCCPACGWEREHICDCWLAAAIREAERG